MLEDHLLQACRRRVDRMAKNNPDGAKRCEAPPVKKQLKSTSVGTFVNATMRSIRSSAALLALILLTSSAAAFSPIALQRSANNAAKCTPNKHSQVDKVKVASSSSVSAALASSNAKVRRHLSRHFQPLRIVMKTSSPSRSGSNRSSAPWSVPCPAPHASHPLRPITICCTAMPCR